MAFYGLGLGTLFFIVGTFAVNLPKAGAWMMGVKWIGGVCLAYMALAYIRDALPRETLLKLAHPDMVYGAVGMVVLVVGLGLGSTHVAAERRKSPIAHLSKPMKLASIVPAIAGLFMVLSWHQVSTASASSASALRWETSEQAAIKRASDEHKPILIDFGATWCGACKELEEKTFPDPKVRAEGARFVALHVDASDDDDPAVAKVRQKYHATEGLPVVVLLDSQGQEAKRFTEFVPPERFAEAMATVQ
jgi:thiol:disulfide interchange protein DsbD